MIRKSDVLEVSRLILSKYSLCDRCLGRQFHLLDEKADSEEIGHSIKLCLHLKAVKLLSEGKRKVAVSVLRALVRSGFKQSKTTLESLGVKNSHEEKCYVCGNSLFSNLDTFLRLIENQMSEVEFNTFQVTSSIPKEILSKDDLIKIEFGISTGESIKTEFNRVLSNLIEEKIRRRHSAVSPDITLLLDPIKKIVTVHPNPLYVYGKYRKLSSGISQTRKVGKDPLTSIEGLLASVFVPAFKAKDVKLHGAGREDVDALMLGSGRPFVLEIIEPKKRTAVLSSLETTFNSSFKGIAEISSLRFCSRKEIVKIKMVGEKISKVYRLRVKADNIPSEEEIANVEKMVQNLVIYQRTPTRVLWRRADKVRKKIIKWIKISPINEKEMEVTLEAQGGTYVKEFIDGDNGRTKPSLAELLNTPLKWESLEVLEIKGE
ncbi:MAG: tRNA pseudouridine(54/55) synthase Pus10 [Thermoproteota archaeon]